MQVTFTDINDYEGESFSFIMEIEDEQMIDVIEQGTIDWQEEGSFKIERNTTYTQEQVSLINKHSDNEYMDRIGFYEFKDYRNVKDWYMDVFYKGIGLKKK